MTPVTATNAVVRMKVTHYGEPNDKTPDTFTRAWIGDHANTLTTASCALTSVARDHLKIPQGLHGSLLAVRLTPKIWFFVTHDDTAPEDEARLDLFNPFTKLPLPGEPDFGDVWVVKLAEAAK